MSGLSCPNCGLTIGGQAINQDGVLYCCQGCADRTYCSCRVTSPPTARVAVSGGAKRS
ncbi:MAG: hypothetical protein HY690_12655 [Chloroflexi bacterium]|nr:hypothetical protein [Chloroflexota bacterium]